MKQPFVAILFILGLACCARAQEGSDPDAAGASSRGRRWWPPFDLAVGPAIKWQMPVEDAEWTDSTLDIVMRPGPRVKSGIVPQGRMGVRPQTTAAVSSKEPGAEGFGSLRLRPFMVGLGWVHPFSPRLSVVASGMAGYSFNKVDRTETPTGVPRLVLAQPVYRIDNSLALEFGGRFWFDLLPRAYLMGGISFLRTRPALTLADGSREAWKADRFRLETGVAFLILRRP